MTATAHHGGHKMFWDTQRDCWVYKDTNEPIYARPRSCGHCGLYETPEGHDGCLGTLPGEVMNACCGHGGRAEGAYIQYGADENGHWVESGMVKDEEALAEFDRLGVGPERVNPWQLVAKAWKEAAEFMLKHGSEHCWAEEDDCQNPDCLKAVGLLNKARDLETKTMSNN